MTREQQIRAALRLLGPLVDDKWSNCLMRIDHWFDPNKKQLQKLITAIDVAIGVQVEAVSKTQDAIYQGGSLNKKQLKKLIKALQRAQYEIDQLPRALRLAFRKWEWDAIVEGKINHGTRLVYKRGPDGKITAARDKGDSGFIAALKGYTQLVEGWLKGSTFPPHRTAHKQRAAVEAARDILAEYSLPIKMTRKGLWHQLSAILFGDPKADLFRHLLAVSKRVSRPDPSRK